MAGRTYARVHYVDGTVTTGRQMDGLSCTRHCLVHGTEFIVRRERRVSAVGQANIEYIVTAGSDRHAISHRFSRLVYDYVIVSKHVKTLATCRREPRDNTERERGRIDVIGLLRVQVV